MAVLAEELPVVGGMSPDIVHCVNWPDIRLFNTTDDSNVEYHSVQPKYDVSLALTVNPMHAISELADYPSIRKLASALYKLDSSQHGAAIMIGAGFSRSAAHHVSGEKKMPLWNDFS